MLTVGPIAVVNTDDPNRAQQLADSSQPFVYRNGERLPIAEFRDKFASAIIKLSSDEFRRTVSDGASTVDEYFERCASGPRDQTLPYGFHDVEGSDLHEGPSLGEDPFAEFVWDTELPTFFKRLSDKWRCEAARVALGPDGSSVNIHRHGAAYNQLLDGRKSWRLYHPYVAMAVAELQKHLQVPNRLAFFEEHVVGLAHNRSGNMGPELFEHFSRWHEQGRSLRPNDRALLWALPLEAELVRGIEIDQEPGDGVLVPPLWGHSVVNHGWTLCRIFQLKNPPLW